MTKEFLEMRSIYKRFGGIQALINVNFSFKKRRSPSDDW